ncbi:MAG: PDZ domain-containing protein [Nitriliruptoraceae bacterium]
MRRALFGVAIVLLAWAALVVPLPLAVTSPVPALPVQEVIEFDDGLPGELDEQLHVTVVRLEPATLAGAARSLTADERELTLLPAVLPPGVDQERFEEFQRELFRESVRAAVAVGFDAAGLEVTIDGDGARVVATVPGTPGAEAFEEDDVITAVDGRDIELASELVTLLGDRRAGEELSVTVRRDGEEVTRTVELVPLEGEVGRIGLGVLVTTVELRIDAPARAQVVADRRIGGPSAGLMLALGAYDAATDQVLGGGRVIAGTGTIDLSGNVGPVDGVAAKVQGARLVDAEVFLVPDTHVAVARDAAPAELEVIGVDTLREAIDALAD